MSTLVVPQGQQPHNVQKLTNEFYQSYQAPGTPGSTMSGSSAGYHSSHSLPSCCSNLVSPVGQDAKTSLEPACPVPDSPSSPRPSSQISGSQHSQQSGYETDQTGLPGYFNASSLQYLPPNRSASAGQSSFGNGRSNFRSRYTHGETYPTRLTIPSSLRSGQTGSGPGQVGYTSYDTRHTGLISPRLEEGGRNYPYRGGASLPRYYRRRTHSNPAGPGARMQKFSASFDHLEYRPNHRLESEPCEQSHEGHVTPVATPISASMSNMQCGIPHHSHV